MTKRPEFDQIIQDKNDTIENLKEIQVVLLQCINQGMLDEEDHFYNEILNLIDEAHLVKTYPELAEVISKAKTLEADIDVWMSMHQRETGSLTWPSPPKGTEY